MKVARIIVVLFGVLGLMVAELVVTGCGGSSSPATSMAADASLVTGLTPVVGTFYLVEERYNPQRIKVGDLEQIRDEDWVLHFEMSDPRLSGDMEQLINADRRADASAELWGSAVIHNDDGTWECSHWTGTIAKGGLEHYIWAEWKGTGAYAGLTYYAQCHFVEAPGAGKPPEQGVAVTGWIQETK
jgi:hypothetical protein